MKSQPDLDEEDRRILSGNSGVFPLSALGSFTHRVRNRGWTYEQFVAAVEDSAILETLVTDGKRYRPQQKAQKMSSAWEWAERKSDPQSRIKHPVALVNLRREAAKALDGDDLALVLGLLKLAEGEEGRGAVNPVMGSVRKVEDVTGLTRKRTHDGLRRLKAAASPDFIIKEVTDYRIQSGESKGRVTRLWTFNLGWLAAPRGAASGGPDQVQGGYIVPREKCFPTRADIGSYFRDRFSNLRVGELLSTAKLAAEIEVSPDRARPILNEMYQEGLIDRVDPGTRTGTSSYRWGRLRTEAEAAEAKAVAKARIDATKDRHQADLTRDSVCKFVECYDNAPPGSRWCPHHGEVIRSHS